MSSSSLHLALVVVHDSLELEELLGPRGVSCSGLRLIISISSWVRSGSPGAFLCSVLLGSGGTRAPAPIALGLLLPSSTPRARTANRRALGDLDLVEPTVLATPALAGHGAILGPDGRTADVPHLAADVTDLAIEVARARRWGDPSPARSTSSRARWPRVTCRPCW